MPDLTTREMMEAIDQTPPVRTFLQKTFFPGEQTHVTEKVEFDVRKGKRIMVPGRAERLSRARDSGRISSPRRRSRLKEC